jgi:hypothetical protein
MDFVPQPTSLSSARGLERLSGNNLRNIFCPYYQGCLDLAVRNDWDDWTCAHCQLRNAEAAKPDVKDYAHQRPRGPQD